MTKPRATADPPPAQERDLVQRGPLWAAGVFAALLLAAGALATWRMQAGAGDTGSARAASSNPQTTVIKQSLFEQEPRATDERSRAEQRLQGYRWIDQSRGFAQIPVERAMQALVEGGHVR